MWVKPGACELQLTLAKCWAVEFPTLWLPLLPAAKGLRICLEELSVPGRADPAVCSSALQAGLPAERQESELWYILQRGQRKKLNTAAVKNKRRKMGCVQNWRRGKQEKKTQKGLRMNWKREKYSFLQTTFHREWCVRGSEQGFPHSDACVNMAEESKSLLLHTVYIFM